MKVGPHRPASRSRQRATYLMNSPKAWPENSSSNISVSSSWRESGRGEVEKAEADLELALRSQERLRAQIGKVKERCSGMNLSLEPDKLTCAFEGDSIAKTKKVVNLTITEAHDEVKSILE